MKVVSVHMASKDEVKVSAVRQAFSAFYAEDQVVVQVYECASSVSNHPRGIVETLTGASNRLRRLTSIVEEFARGTYLVSVQKGIYHDGYIFGVVLLKKGAGGEVKMGITEKFKSEEEGAVWQVYLEEAVGKILKENY